MRRPFEHVARRTLLDDAAVVHDDDAVGQEVRVERVVGDEDRGAVGEDVGEHSAELRRDRDVEGGERFVEQQQARLGRERAGDRHALRLAARRARTAGGRRTRWCPCAAATRRLAAAASARDAPVARGPKATLLRTVRCGNSSGVLREQGDSAAVRRCPRCRAGRTGRRHPGSPDRGPGARGRRASRAPSTCRRRSGRAAASVSTVGDAEVDGHVAAPRARASIRRLTPRLRCGAAARPPGLRALARAVRDGDDHDRDGDEHQRQGDGGVRVGLALQVDLERQGARHALQAAGEGQRRAELAEGAGEGEDGAGHDRGQHERQRHPEQHGGRSRAEGRGDGLVARAGRAERALQAEHEERQRDEGLGDHDGRRREGDVERAAEQAAPAVQREQCEAADDRRQHEREQDDGAHDPLPGERHPGEHDRHRDAEHEADHGRHQRGAQAEEQRVDRRRRGDQRDEVRPSRPGRPWRPAAAGRTGRRRRRRRRSSAGRRGAADSSAPRRSRRAEAGGSQDLPALADRSRTRRRTRRHAVRARSRPSRSGRCSRFRPPRGTGRTPPPSRRP